jgi:opacity protein-like surface antigen
MKKFFVFMLAALIGVATSLAQVVESRMGGVYIEKGPSPESRWFLKLGGGIATEDRDESPWFVNDVSKPSGTAWDLSLGFNRDFKHGGSWYWGFKLGATYTMITQKLDKGEYVDSWDGERSTYKWDSASCDINRINLHVGPTIGYRKRLGNDIKLDINFTPEFVLRYSTSNDDDAWLEYSVLREWPGTIYDSKYDEFCDYFYDDYNRCVASATLGVDLWIKKFIVGINYRYMFDFDYNPQTVMLNVGFAF